MYVTRQNQKVIFDSFFSSFISAVLGSRRVGKSTLVEEFIRENSDKKWIQINMDRMAERHRVDAQELDLLIEEKSLQKIDPARPLWIAIDEAQKAPALFEQIKMLYDRHKGTSAIKFILTGSGFLHLHRLSAESLAGRIQIHYLREFSLGEQGVLAGGETFKASSVLSLLFKNESSDRLREAIEARRPSSTFLKQILSEQLVWGGLPEIGTMPKDLARPNTVQYLADYLQTYLEKDIRDVETISDLNLFQRLMEILAEQTGSLREDKKIIEALGCNRETLKKYRGYLEATLVYQEIFPFIQGTLRRLVKSPKGYMTNNGLVSYLMGIYQMALLEKTGGIGHRFENWVLKEIQTCLDGRPDLSRIYFWRTSGGVEVDLVVDLKPDVFPFEITWSQKKDSEKVKHLRAFLSDHPKAKAGIIFYNGDYFFDTESKIHFIPAWALA